jgi:uncharacterized RDD family membrane protein YckC
MASSGLFCTWCGEINAAQADYCGKCGARLAGPGAAAAAPDSPPSGPSVTAGAAVAFDGDKMVATAPLQPIAASVMPPVYPPPYAVPSGFSAYAGFWIRFLATLIDSAVLTVVMLPIVILAFVLLGVAGAATSMTRRGPDAAANAAVLVFTLVVAPTFMAIAWFYEAKMTSSAKQATLGKIALGLKVIDKEGKRLSFMHATGRYFAKMINNFTFYVGWIMAGFTERKQGLHDIIAGTYVIKA